MSIRWTPSRRIPLAVFLVGAVGLLASAFFLDRSMRASALQRGGAELDAVARLKVQALEDYREALERLAESATDSSILQTVARAHLRLDPDLQARARDRLIRECARQELLGMALVAEDGQVIEQHTRPGAPPFRLDAALLSEALSSPRTAVSRLRAEVQDGYPRLDVAAAVRDATGRPLGAIYLRRDVTSFLAALVGSWPVPNRSGETVLARRDGDQVLFITEPRGRTGWSLTTRVPLAETRRGLVRAALGERGVFQAIDFRDVPILLSARAVPDSDWLVLTRIDVAELEAPVVRTVRVVGGGLALLLLACAGALNLWFRREDRQHRVLAKASQALEEGEARLRLALHGTSFVWEWDLVEGRLTADPEWGRHLGFTSAMHLATLDDFLAAVVMEEDRVHVRELFEAHFRGATPLIEAEFRALAADGAARWISIRGRVFVRDAAGRPARAIGVVADVTARRRAQAQLERSQRLLSLGTLAAGVAHEINNPLTYVLDAAGLLAAELPGAAPGRPDLAEAARHVRDGAERVREVVRRLRAFSRQGTQRAGPVDVGEEVAAAVRMAGHELRHRARLVVRSAAAPLVLAGEHQLGQVFLNLLLNAAYAVEEAGRPEGLITVAVGTDAAGWARVEVRDTGTGISAQVLPHIFEPFFTTRGQGSGTGLGLAIAWAEVESAGGRIEVESEEGRGSTFRVLLPPAPPGPARPAAPPLAAPSGDPPAAPPAEPASTFRPRVLVVDDDPLVARSIGRAIGRAFEVLTAASGAEALEHLAHGRFDAVVCDLMMPGMTGMELHERVAAMDAAQAARFVFVTGGAFTEAARQFLDGSAAPRVEKPFEPTHLRAVVDEVARRGGATPPRPPGQGTPIR